LEATKGMISLVSHRSEHSKKEREISEIKRKNRSETKMNQTIARPRKNLKRKRTEMVKEKKRKNRTEFFN
jgi:hypothetical protein